MRLGAENRLQLIILLVLLVIGVIAVPYFASSGPKVPQSTGSASAAAAAKKPTVAQRSGKRPPLRKHLLPDTLDPALRFDLLGSEKQEYDGGKRNIFEARSIEIPPVVDPEKITKKEPQGPVTPPPPPAPPAIPLKFYGFATQPGQAKRIFLASTNGDDIFVGSEGQVINRRYRIVKINNASVEIEDILNNNKQTIPLTSQS